MTAHSSNADLIQAAIDACRAGKSPNRQLDSQVARAIFSHLAAMQEIEVGIWQNADGTRMTAPRYSSSVAAAMTLIPSGYRLEDSGSYFVVVGDSGSSRGRHKYLAIGLCIAALRCRLVNEITIPLKQDKDLRPAVHSSISLG